MKKSKKRLAKTPGDVLDENEGLMIEFFQVEKFSPCDAVAAMSSALINMSKDIGWSEEEFQGFLNGLMNIYKKRK